MRHSDLVKKDCQIFYKQKGNDEFNSSPIVICYRRVYDWKNFKGTAILPKVQGESKRLIRVNYLTCGTGCCWEKCDEEKAKVILGETLFNQINKIKFIKINKTILNDIIE